MSTMWQLYHQILHEIIGNSTNTQVILPDKRLDNNQYCFPEQIFPNSTSIDRIPDNPSALSSVEKIDFNALSTILVLPPMESIKGWPVELKEKFLGYHRIESIVLGDIVQKTSPGSVIIALMPNSFFTDQKNRIPRENIFSIAQPVIFIKHQPPWAHLDIPIHHAFLVSTIVMVKNENTQQPVRFFKLEKPENEAQAKEILDDFRKLLKQNGGQTRYGYVIRDRNQIGDRWNYDYHHPEVLKRKQDLNDFGDARKISDVFDVQRGKIHIANDSNSFVENTTEKGYRGVPLIEGRDLRLDRNLGLETRYCVVDPPPQVLLKRGDILIRALHVFPSNTNSFPVVEVADDKPIAASQSVLILRPKAPMNDTERAFILAYLRSDSFLNFLSVENNTVNIQPTLVADIPVPIPEEDLITALKSIEEAREKFQSWIKEAEDARNSIFKMKSNKDAKLITLSAGRLARQRLEAGQLVEDYRHRVRTQFPYPLAYQWRAVEAGREDSEGYDQVLNTAEITLCYLACMAIIAANSIPGGKVKWLENIALNLCDKRHGTSLGDWIAILRETCLSQALKKSEDSVPFYEVINLLSDNDVNSAVQRLKKRRDDFAHRRGPKGQPATQKAYLEAKSDLETLFRAIDFLTEYPLRYIETTRRDSIEKQTFYTYRELRGDHPFVPIAEDVYSDNELEAGSLYLVDRKKKMFLLRPLLFRKECPECGAWSTFYLDTYDAKTDTPVMKSMEHGHTSAEHDLSRAFRALGLIKEIKERG